MRRFEVIYFCKKPIKTTQHNLCYLFKRSIRTFIVKNSDKHSPISIILYTIGFFAIANKMNNLYLW